MTGSAIPNSADARQGVLYLVPTPLDFACPSPVALSAVLPERTMAIAARLSFWICENAKSARAFLNRVSNEHPLAKPLREQSMAELPRAVHKKGDHLPGQFDARPLLGPALNGQDVGLISEAGMPAVADPGSSVVAAAHALGLRVIPLVGPVSPLLALAASGLNGQNFAFQGYLPQEANALEGRIRTLEQHSHRSGQTQLFIETPFRNQLLWGAMVRTLQPSTRLAYARSLTLDDADCRCSTVANWRKNGGGPVNGTPAVFVFGP